MSEPFSSRIKARQHAVQPPKGNQYTYPVLNEKLKCDTSSDSGAALSDSEATEIYSIPSDTELQNEIEPSNTPEGKFVTKTCSVKNLSKDTKKSSKHQHKCPKCNYQAESSSLINIHYKNSHEPISFEHCSLSFSTSSTLHRHLYFHKDLKCLCNKCPKNFRSSVTCEYIKLNTLNQALSEMHKVSQSILYER